MEIITGNFIGNTISAEGNTFRAFNPAKGESIAPDFFEATSAEVDQAVRLAHDAFQTYRQTTGEQRATFLETIAEEILSLGDDLIGRCQEETGLPAQRLVGERGRTVGQLKMFAALVREGSWVNARIDRADPDRQPLPKPDIRSMSRSLGPVGVFGASNFPLAFSVAGGDTASALAAGCTVVVKAHPAHPGTCALIGTAIRRAVKRCEMPEGTFSMVHGPSVETGLAIVRHPLIAAIGFTGSFKGGKAIFDEAARRPVPIPVYAEMGSVNPVFILPEAMKTRGEAIARDLAASVTLGTGQFCTNPGLVLVQSSDDVPRFREGLSSALATTPPGVMLSEGIRDNYVRGIERLRSRKVSVAGGKRAEGENGFTVSACLLEASAGAFLADHALEEEVFGPSTLLVTASSKAELYEAAKKLSGHLTATIHGTERDLEEASELVELLEQKAGRLIVNGYPTGVEVCHSMIHGGPFPATTDSRTTSVGTHAIHRFVRPVCYQNFPEALLPPELRDDNPLDIWRMVDGAWTR